MILAAYVLMALILPLAIKYGHWCSPRQPTELDILADIADGTLRAKGVGGFEVVPLSQSGSTPQADASSKAH